MLGRSPSSHRIAAVFSCVSSSTSFAEKPVGSQEHLGLRLLPLWPWRWLCGLPCAASGRARFRSNRPGRDGRLRRRWCRPWRAKLQAVSARRSASAGRRASRWFPRQRRRDRQVLTPTSLAIDRVLRPAAAKRTIRARFKSRCNVTGDRQQASSTLRSFLETWTSLASGIIPMLNHDSRSKKSGY
jgi:hypothetical protein